MSSGDCVFVARGGDSNAGAGTCTCRSRGGAQTNLCDGKDLVEGEIPLLSTEEDCIVFF